MDIVLTEEDIKSGILVKFNKLCPGAFEVFAVLMAYASERSKVAKISLKTIIKKTGFSLTKIVGILNRLKEVEFVEAPFEGQQGKPQIYRLKILIEGKKKKNV